MRRLILLVVLFISALTFAQESHIIKIGIDPKLVINGAYDYDSTPILDIQLTLLTQFNSGLEVGLTVEYANLKPTYYHYGLTVNKIVYSTYRFETLVGADALVLFRDFKADKKQLFMMPSVNAEMRYYFTDIIGIGVRYNYKYRTDYNMLKDNLTIELILKF